MYKDPKGIHVLSIDGGQTLLNMI